MLKKKKMMKVMMMTMTTTTMTIHQVFQKEVSKLNRQEPVKMMKMVLDQCQ